MKTKTIITLCMLVLLIASTSCGSRYTLDVRESESEIGFGSGNYKVQYGFVEIEGMPCLVCKMYYGVAITCDWSQYNGD